MDNIERSRDRWVFRFMVLVSCAVMTLIILLIDPRISMWIPMAAFLYWVVALRTPGIQGKPWRNGWAAGVVAGVLFGLMLRQYMDY